MALLRQPSRPELLHATQSVEKYLKALALSILGRGGISATTANTRGIKHHSLPQLAMYCASTFSRYAEPEIVARLERFTEFDQATRSCVTYTDRSSKTVF